MSFDQDPNEQANISGADLAVLVDQRNDLLEALQRAATCMEMAKLPFMTAALTQARAAIAKATGSAV